MNALLARIRVERVLCALGGLLVVGAALFVATGGVQPAVVREQAGTLAAFFVAIALGHLFPVRQPASREIAPIAAAASLALAMSHHSLADGAHLRALTVIAITAAAMATGLLVRAATGAAVSVTNAAIALIGVSVAAALFRGLPLFDGLTLLEQMRAQNWPKYAVATAMVLVSLVALTLEAVLFALARSSRTRAPVRVTMLDEAKAAAGLSAALSASGTLIAVAEPVLTAAAVPLFLLPLVMTQFAVRRQVSIRDTYGQTVRSLSRLTELGGYTDGGHAERVAALSAAVGTQLGLPEKDMRDLEYAALLHDIGQVSLRVPIPGGATVLAAPADQRRIAADGADIVRQAGVLDAVAHIIEVQTTPYRQVVEFGEELPVASRIIKVVNAYEDLVAGSDDPARRDGAIERIQLGLGYEYDPKVVDALTRAVTRRPRPGLVVGPGGGR